MKKIKQIKAGLIGIEIENNSTAVVFDKKKKSSEMEWKKTS